MVSIDWNSRMFPVLRAMIEAEQARKEEAERKARLRERHLEFAKIYISEGIPANEPEDGPFMMPSYGMFKDEPRVQALLTEDDCRIPFTEDRFEQVEDLIAEGAIKYNIHARQDLARIHGLHFHGENEEETDEYIIKPFLAKATTVFRFDCEASLLSYQYLTEIFHLSLWNWEPRTGDPPPWRLIASDITPDVLAGEITRELLRVAGAPENSTWEQMERIGKKLVCTCRKPRFEQPVDITVLVSLVPLALFISVGEPSLTWFLQIKHIKYERTWDIPPEVERFMEEGQDEGSCVNFSRLSFHPTEPTLFLCCYSLDYIDHAVSKIHDFVKVLPEGTSFDDFMRTQPPPLGGTVGNVSEIRHPFPMLGLILRLAEPPAEEKMFVCAHCECSMKKDYLVWHMNAKWVCPPLFFIPSQFAIWDPHLVRVSVFLDIRKSRARAT
jgi:hypothetical protein